MTTLSRRAFATGLVAGPALAATPALIGRAPSASARAKAPSKAITPLARVSIGRFEVTFLNDGHTRLPYGVFTGREASAIEAAAAGYHATAPEGLRLAFNQYLIRDGETLVLVDSGPAGQIGETGKLPSALDAVGVTPDQIDAVIFTHLHFDHISGAIAGGRKVFANAEVYADVRDVRHFTDPAKKAAAPDLLASSFAASEALVRLYPNLQRIDGERDIAPGISIVDLTGHTPGHIGVRIADGGESLMLVSDMLFHPALHPVADDIGIAFEQDPAAAEAMREAFFPRAAEEGALIAATHMPFPGLGRIVSDRGALRWLPADWA